MGKMLSTARRAVKNFNIEYRAMKYIDKSSERTESAPKHPGTLHCQLDETDLEKLFLPDEQHNKRIDKFEIQSIPVKKGILPDCIDYVKESTRRLPQKFDGPDPFPEPLTDFGFIVPESLPVGRLTMRQAVNLVKAYQLKELSISELAVKYSLDEKKVGDIVEHFMLFTSPIRDCWLPPLLDIEAESHLLLDEPIAEKIDEGFSPGGEQHQTRFHVLRQIKSK